MKSLLALLLLTVTASAQTSGQYLFQRVGINGFVNQFITPQTGKYLKFQGGSLVLDTPTGGVTDFIFTDSTGIDGTVTNSTSTPTLSLSLTKAAVGLSLVENTALSTWVGSSALTTLGAITTGTFQATPIADAYISSAATWNAKQPAGNYVTTLTGDVTATGPVGGGSAAATLANTTVIPASYTNANITVDSKGRITAAANGTGGGITALTGDVTASGTGSVAATIANDSVTYAKMQNVTAASRLLGRESSSAGDVQEITIGNGLTMTGTTLAVNSINASVLLGRNSISSGQPEEILLGTGLAMTLTTVSLANTTVTPASYTNANITVDQQGRITSASNGSSGTKTIRQFTPRDNQPPATAFATLDTRNSIAVLDFDTATPEEAAIFVGIIPEGATLTSGITVRITWTAETATSGNCRWGAQWMRCNTDIDSDSFDTATEVTTTTNATSGIPNVTSITCTAIDGVTVGDMYRLRIYRDTGDAADTMAGDSELLTVEVRTAN